MAVFATEFPVQNSINRGIFAAQVIAWVKGMSNSSLFDQGSGLEKLEGEATLRAQSGESLTLRECQLREGFAIGARHEIPDGDGRIWRSEVILKSMLGKSALRARTQCIVSKAGAHVQIPKKPYFIKLALDDNWPDQDDKFRALSTPRVLQDDELDLAAEVIGGQFDTSLPVVYVSRAGTGELGISEYRISNLAFHLGGLAHVLVEPSRDFSRRLQAATGGKNPYGGAVGICVSGLGIARRFLLGLALTHESDVTNAVSDFCSDYMANKVPRFSWEWQDLLEESNKQFRARATSSSEEIEIWNQLRNEENLERDEQIKILREQVDTLQKISLTHSAQDRPNIISSFLVDKIGVEIYDDEFSDRILRLLKEVADGKLEVDNRTLYIVRRINLLSRYSGGASKLEERIKAAGRDSTTADARLGDILLQLGFQRRLQGGHPVYVPSELEGISQQTLSSSSSDYRAGRNAAAQIVRDLFLTHLKD